MPSMIDLLVVLIQLCSGLAQFLANVTSAADPVVLERAKGGGYKVEHFLL